MTNDQARRLLQGVYDVLMSHYPIGPGDDVSLQFCAGIGFAAGAIHEALQAEKEGRAVWFERIAQEMVR